MVNLIVNAIIARKHLRYTKEKKNMKQVKEYRIDGKEPTDEEFKECINIVNSENCRKNLFVLYFITTIDCLEVTISG